METKPPKLSSESGVNKTYLGQILVELGYVTVYQLEEALKVQQSDRQEGTDPKPLGQILLEFGYCSPNQLIRAIQVQVEYRDAQLHK
jgi:AraC-like DNA-binding protein